MRLSQILLAFLFVVLTTAARADDIGCVSTTVRYLGMANDKICVTAFHDEDVGGIVCHISRAETGGVKGKVGVAESPSEVSIACHQTGPITIKDDLKNGEKVFKENRSFLFKTLQVVRFYDKGNNSLVYLAYSDKLINGSPKNAVSAVTVAPWPAQ